LTLKNSIKLFKIGNQPINSAMMESSDITVCSISTLAFERALLNINFCGMFEENTTRIVAAQSEERSIEQAQRDVYESHRHRVFSVAFHMTGNELEAEQLLTDSFVHAFQASPEPDSGIIDGALIAGLRSRFALTPASTAPISASAGMDGKNVRRTDLEEALRELPPFERLAFLLRDVEGYTPESISQLLDVPQAEINRTLFSARIRLRGILSGLKSERAA
jgi:DNA-directed RNA polymerase specialized sigma24 family protein